MDFNIDVNTEDAILKLTGALTVYSVTEVAEKIIEYGNYQLDLQEVNELDGAGLQLLVMARRDAQIQFMNCSPVVNSIFELAGVPCTNKELS